MNESVATSLDFQPARVLLGWMETEDALRAHQGYRGESAVSTAAAERLRIARERVAARRAGVDQRDVVMPAPPQLADYVGELRRHRYIESVLGEGWTPSMIDLSRLCAFQARVYTENARVRAVDAGDLASIAAVTLPAPATAATPASFDRARNAWVLSSPDPNLRVVGNFSQQLGDAAGFGFSVSLGSSFIAAIQHAGRHYLADGYHRAVAFLQRGITHVPALTRTLHEGEPFALPAGMLPAAAYLGDRPPLLSDFLDDEVSLAVELPVFRKVIVIQAVEVMA